MSIHLSRTFLAGLILGALPLSAGPFAHAEEARDANGVPGATTVIDGGVLPPAPEAFKGEIAPNAARSTPAWPARITPPEGAPNILLIMLDDVGFGAPSTFGGVIPTPALDRIAASGLRYTAFHTTALCSPTRAALLTGRNHHSVGNGVVADQATGFPGYNSIIPRDAAAIGEILRQHGYDTSWFGKEHNVPQWESTEAGPFTDWPTGPIKGFDYFYGFLGADASQWHAGNLFRNKTHIAPGAEPGWNLVTAMADEAVDRIRMLNEVQPDRPFMIYYAPGATHSPHHPTKEWVDRIHALHLFDDGWNKLRETIFARQKALGVIPETAKLTEWPDGLPKWEALSDAEKKLFIRQAEVYAAFLTYTDHEIGRVVQAIDDAGKLDSTLVIYIAGDNGASPEGTLNGLHNEFSIVNAVAPSVEENLKFYEEWGSEETYPHFAAPWAWAFDTPYKWTKQIASHLGGTRVGMAISWPERIKEKGGVRPQFHHVVDIVPTILDAAGIPAPATVNGVPQKPLEGVSMAYTWDRKASKAPGRRHTQYFEMMGRRALYHDGWIASTTPPAVPWEIGLTSAPEDVMNGFEWELYDLSKDWTQAENLAAEQPEKLREMQQRFIMEATKYQVFPLDGSALSRFLSEKPGFNPGRTKFVYKGTRTGLFYPATGSAPDVLNRSYRITADITIPEDGAEGMLATQGGRFAGYGFYLKEGRPIFTWNLLNVVRIKWRGDEALAPGRHKLEFIFDYDGPGLGKGGAGTLKVDGKAVDRRTMPRTLPVSLMWDEPFSVGVDEGTPVDDGDYKVPFAFTGEIRRLEVDIAPGD